MRDWAACHADLAELAGRRLFFVGGAPRSGTTWLQQILDSHPDISCRGEGLFWHHLAQPLHAMVQTWRDALAEKNMRLFAHTGGYPLPGEDDADILLGTAVLLAFQRQAAGSACRAIGEKTPENVFLFPRLLRLFPAARFIGIARDPRDVLTSAWHFLQAPTAGGDGAAAKTAFLQRAMPALADGARALLALHGQHPAASLVLTYEALRRDPAAIVTQLFRFLGVADDAATVAACVARTTFAALAAASPSGAGRDGAFLRKGVVGDWPSTLTPAMNEMILCELGWMFPHFGWQP